MPRHNEWLFDATIHFNPTNNSIHFVVYDIDGRCVSKEFDETSTLADFQGWAQDPDTWIGIEPVARSVDSQINYSHDTGKLQLITHRQERAFDPNDDEDLARLVKHLKRLNPMAQSRGQRAIPNLLPEPTEAELARRTIYSNVGVPDGTGGKYTNAKPRYLKQSASRARSEEIAKQLLADMFNL